MKINRTLEKTLVLLTGFGVVGGSLFFLYKTPQRDLFPVDISLTETFSKDIQLDLDWEDVDNKTFKSPNIRINRKLLKDEVLEKAINESAFEVEFNNSTNFITVQLSADSKKLNTNSQRTNVKAEINSVFNAYQKITLFEHLGDQINLEHALKHELVKSIDLGSITYHLYNQDGDLLESVKPTHSEIKNGILSQKVSILSTAIKDEDLIFMGMSYKINGILYSQYLKDFDNSPYIATGNHNFDPMFINGFFTLKKNNNNKLLYRDFSIHGESLHLKTSLGDKATEYELVSLNPSSKRNYTFPYSAEINKGIELDTLDSGDYLIKLDNEILTTVTSEEVITTWYTVTRNKTNKYIELKNYNGLVVLSINTVSQLPSHVYDVVIDAGHGGPDAGATSNGMIEKDEALKVAKYVAKELEKKGLKVKLTRTDDEIHVEKSTSDYEKKPFLNNGRVDTIYNTQAKLVISNHLNAHDGDDYGSEVYSSIWTSNDWASSIINEFKEAGRLIRPSNNEYVVSEGSYKKSNACHNLNHSSCEQPFLDYMYIIRETGGTLTHPSTLMSQNTRYTQAPKRGAESILVEYIYLDVASERDYWRDNWKTLADSVVTGTLNYLGIKN